MDLTSDPHAWLRPYYVAIKNDGAYWMLAGPQRFEALCCAVEPEHPSRAAAMREWSPAAQKGILGWLETVTQQKPAVQEVELWRVTKDVRELRCVVRYMPIHAERLGSAAKCWATNSAPRSSTRTRRASGPGRTSGTKNCLIVVGDQARWPPKETGRR